MDENQFHEETKGLALVFYYMCWPFELPQEVIPTGEEKDFLSTENNEGNDNS